MDQEKCSRRNSGIELIKIIAIFIIVISHVTQTLSETQPIILNQPYVIDLTKAYVGGGNIPLVIFRVFGALGNDIFFVASFWFLSDDMEISLKKIINILVNAWVISIGCMFIMLFINKSVSILEMIQFVFPTVMSSNWFITCYILIYLVHVFLNIGLNQLSEVELKKIVIVSSLLYLVLGLLKSDLLFSNNLVVSIVIYIVVFYLKHYKIEFMNKITVNCFFVIIGMFILGIMVVATNWLGIMISSLDGMMLHWGRGSNPAILLLSLSLFNLFRLHTFYNRFINYISKLSLYIYLIHENLYVRRYVRPYIWRKIYELDYSGLNLIVWIIFFSAGLYLSSVGIAAIYNGTIGKVVSRFNIRDRSSS